MGLLHRSRLQCRVAHLEVLSLEREVVGREQPTHDLDRLFERVETIAQRRERDAELGVLFVEPRGTVGELEAPVRRVVDRDGLGREHRRMAIRHTGDEQAEPNVLRHSGERGECRVPLEALTRSRSVHRLEVVEAPHAVERGIIGKLCARHYLREWNPLLRDVEPESHLYWSAFFSV